MQTHMTTLEALAIKMYVPLSSQNSNMNQGTFLRASILRAVKALRHVLKAHTTIQLHTRALTTPVDSPRVMLFTPLYSTVCNAGML